VKKSIGVKNKASDDGISQDNHDDIMAKMKEVEATKLKFEAMEAKIAKLEPLQDIQEKYTSLELKFETLKAKSIALFQDKLKLEEDNQALSGLVFKYKNDKSEIMRVSQNAIHELKQMNQGLVA
jgi:hypothetical protein